MLSFKRAKNLELCVKQLRLSAHDLAQALLDMSEDLVPEPALEALARDAPSMEEMEALVRLGADALSGPEQYIVALARVPRLKPRLAAWLAARRFQPMAADCADVLKGHARAARVCVDSSALRAAVRLVRDAGNLLNDGTARGGARGFDVAVLPALDDFRSTDHWKQGASSGSRPSMTLLGFLCAEHTKLMQAVVAETKSAVGTLKLRSESSCKALADACEATLETIVRETAAHPIRRIDKLKTFAVFEEQLPGSEESAGPPGVADPGLEGHEDQEDEDGAPAGDRFLTVMAVYRASADAAMAEVASALAELRTALAALCTAYGMREPPKGDTEASPLQPFVSFVQQVDRRVVEVVSQRQRPARGAGDALPHDVRQAIARRAERSRGP